LDIDPETFCLSAEDLQAKRSGIDALIAVHMFGNLCDMPKILEIMAGMPVIEDCAQSLGSKFDGRACGSFGDIAFFSFRSGKYLSVGEGGALYSIRADLRARISELIKDLPIPTPYQEMKHMAETYIRSKLRSQPGWGLVGTKIWSLYNKRTEFADKSPIVLSRIFTSDLATARRRMPHLGTMISIQRAYAEYYENTLHLDAGMYCLEKPPAFYNRFMYPLIFPSRGQRDTMAAHLKMYGIGTSSPYEEAIAGAAKHYRYAGDCPSAERILQTALVIPSFYKLKSQAVERIAKRIGEAWSADIRHHHSPRPDGERRT
jgi:dTDP-4-amino-4,6-dideoxygalactose transaminase